MAPILYLFEGHWPIWFIIIIKFKYIYIYAGPVSCPLSSHEDGPSVDTQLRSLSCREAEVDMSCVFDTVCEETVAGAGDTEEFFTKKFDQLERLHELYKSVSSISAASQSRLELNSNLVPGQLQLQHRSASFSLTGGQGSHQNSAANRSISEVVQSRRRPLLGPPPG